MKSRKRPSTPAPNHSLYLKHIGILVSGVLIGLCTAYVLRGFPYKFQENIESARELGIVSKTILIEHPASLDVLNYALVLCLPVLFALIPWLIWSRGNRERLSVMFGPTGASLPSPSVGQIQRLLLLLLVFAGGLFVTFNINMFFRPAFSPAVGAWIFLGEEGVVLDWAYRTINGDVYGRDYHCLYGPLMVYPLAWFLKVFGMSAVTARIYGHMLNLIAYATVILFLYKTLRSRLTFVLSSVIFLCAFNMITVFAPSTTILRIVLGVVPLFLMYFYRRSARSLFLVLAGVAAGQSVLFSQEAGICSIATVALLLVVDCFNNRDLKRVAREGGVFLASTILSMSPFLVYFWLNGALGGFIGNIYGNPRLVSLGYGGLPFPSFRDFVAQPLAGGKIFYYWVIFVYVYSLLALLPRFLLGAVDRDAQLKLALTIFGIFLFRAALGRSDEFNVFKASVPAFLLCFLYIDQALHVLKEKCSRDIKIGYSVFIAAMVLSLLLVFTYSPLMKKKLVVIAGELQRPGAKFSVRQSGVFLPEVERTGVFVDEATAKRVRDIQAFLSIYTKPGEYVYFFPNESAYYFLLDRRNPTRFGMSYHAASREHRLQIVEDLEKNRPHYVVFNVHTWRVDRVPETIMVPEVVSYLRANYRPFKVMGDVEFYERIDQKHHVEQDRNNDSLD